MSPDIAVAVEIFHQVADEQNDAADHDEFHAAASVMALLNGAILDQKEYDYIVRWLESLEERM